MAAENRQKSERQVRVVLLVALIALLVTFAAVAIQSVFVPYKKIQRTFAATHAGVLPPPFGIRTVTPCTGQSERCTTCHLGMGRADLTDKKIPLPFRAHGPGLGKHDPTQIGCTVCHGGEGRALDPIVSHASPTQEEPDPLMKAPHVQAACSRCHIPGAKKGQERLLEGAKLYAGLGCPVCHPLTENGTGGFDFGPDIRAAGRSSIAHLKTSLIDPAADFEGSTMPSFKLALNKDPKAFESLIVYLESLPLPRQPACAPQNNAASTSAVRCTNCHDGPAGRASGRAKHNCPYLIERKEDLRCASCHKESIPESKTATGDCPVIRNHREACAVCHE